jgi:hypothetical protein
MKVFEMSALGRLGLKRSWTMIDMIGKGIRMIGLGHQVFVVEGESMEGFWMAVVRFWRIWAVYREGRVDTG